MRFSPKFGEKGIGSTYYYRVKCLAVPLPESTVEDTLWLAAVMIVGDGCAAVLTKQERIPAIVS